MEKKLLIIDDDQDLAMITHDMLTNYGYEVTMAHDCTQAFEMLGKDQYGLLLLDINLPDGTGFELCEELRKVSQVPVIFASARTSEDDKITGLDLGGDDYLAKPYSLKELLSRINAIWRRVYGVDVEDRILDFHDLKVDLKLRKVIKHGKEIKLSLKGFDVLAYLCTHPNMILAKETILKEVWGIYSEVEISTVAVHIRWLREKLEEDPAHPTWIKTVWGVGYEFHIEQELSI